MPRSYTLRLRPVREVSPVCVSRAPDGSGSTTERATAGRGIRLAKWAEARFCRAAPMKFNAPNQAARQTGLTLVEVLVLIAIIAIIVALIPHGSHSGKTRAQRIICSNNLKQVGLSYRVWANDHEGQYPFAYTSTGGSTAWKNSPETFRHFQVLSNELVTPKILICRADQARRVATNFHEFSNANLSYFVGLDAREDAPHSILSGDRNITGGMLSNGFLRVLNANSEAGWTKEIHQDAGNIGLGDGSVQQLTVAGLRRQIALAATNSSFIRLAIP